MNEFVDIIRANGEKKTIRIVDGHLFVCTGCCCGNTETGHAEVPIERFKQEWKERGIRKRIHLTISGCLGPCAVSNVVLLIYRGKSVWFHSIDSDSDVVQIYNYIDNLLARGRFVPPYGALSRKVFQRYSEE